MIDLYLRIATQTRWLTLAINRGLADIDGVPAPGVLIDEIGPITLQAPVYGPSPAPGRQGELITPGVYDTWHWVNLRLHGQRFADDVGDPLAGEGNETLKFFRSRLAQWIRAQSTPLIIRGIRVYQFGVGDSRVQIIDPRDFPDPPRVWAGGMEP